MLLLLQERLMGDCDLYCSGSDVGTTGIPRSSTTLRLVMTGVHSKRGANSTSGCRKPVLPQTVTINRLITTLCPKALSAASVKLPLAHARLSKGSSSAATRPMILPPSLSENVNPSIFAQKPAASIGFVDCSWQGLNWWKDMQ